MSINVNEIEQKVRLKIKFERIKKAVSQEELANKLGVTRQSVSKWEVGTAYPEMTNIVALCTLFNCKITDLINDTIIDYEKFNDDVKEIIIATNPTTEGETTALYLAKLLEDKNVKRFK